MSENGEKVSVDTVGLGTGGGTLVALLSNLWEPNSFWYNVCIYMAPTATVVLSAAWYLTKKTAIDYLDDKNFDAVMASARATMQQAIDNDSSPEHKEKLQKIVQDLEIMKMETYKNRLKLNYE